MTNKLTSEKLTSEQVNGILFLLISTAIITASIVLLLYNSPTFNFAIITIIVIVITNALTGIAANLLSRD